MANGIQDVKTQVAILVIVLSLTVYKTLRDLCHPEASDGKTYADKQIIEGN